jgi:hypothetical protein
MSNADLQLTIGADASAAAQGFSQLKSAVSQLTLQLGGLRTTFGGLAGSVTTLSSSVAGLANNLRSAGAQGGEGLASLQRQSGGAASAVEGLTSKTSTLFKSAGEMARALKSVGMKGAEGFGEAGAAAGAAVEIIGTVVGLAQSGAEAMSDWAASTLANSKASAEARDNAAELTKAMKGAHDQLGELGELVGNAFAPLMTTLVDGFSDLVKQFIQSYERGGLAKQIMDGLVLSVKSLIAVLVIVVTPIVGMAKALQDAVGLMRFLWQGFLEFFSDGWRNVSDVVRTEMKVIKDAWRGDLIAAAKDAKQGWGILEADSKKWADDVQADAARAGAAVAKFNRDQLAIGAGAAGFLGGLFGAPEDKTNYFGLTKEQMAALFSRGGGVHPTLGRGRGRGSRAAAVHPPSPSTATSDCDPVAAKACATEAAAGKTDALKQGQENNVATVREGAAEIDTSNQAEAEKYVDHKQQEVAASAKAEAAKVEANNTANRQINEANDKALKDFEASVKGVVNTFAKGLLQMAEGAKSLGQVLREVGQKMLTDWVDHIAKMVSDWAAGMVRHLLVTNTTNAAIKASNKLAANENLAVTLETNLKKIVSDAKTAAANAYNWASAWGGPIAGAAAAAAAFAGVMAFEASAAGGYDIPAGVNPVTQLHAQEMVLPARLANPMREMLASFGAGEAPWGAPTAGHTISFGDTVIHGAPNMSPAEFRAALTEHRASVADAVANALRGGWRPNYRQPIGAL